MTNSITILILLQTNWLPMSISQPVGDGSVAQSPHEIGITLSNRYATVIADNRTNKILLSSEVVKNSVIVRKRENGYYITNDMRFPPAQHLIITNLTDYPWYRLQNGVILTNPTSLWTW
jgi:hypothetical protein